VRPLGEHLTAPVELAKTTKSLFVTNWIKRQQLLVIRTCGLSVKQSHRVWVWPFPICLFLIGTVAYFLVHSSVRWQSPSHRHQHPVPPGTDAGHSDAGGSRKGIRWDGTLHGVSPPPQDPRDSLHIGQGRCKAALLWQLHKLQVQENVLLTIKSLCSYDFSVLQGWSSKCLPSILSCSRTFVSPFCHTSTSTDLSRWEVLQSGIGTVC